MQQTSSASAQPQSSTYQSQAAGVKPTSLPTNPKTWLTNLPPIPSTQKSTPGQNGQPMRPSSNRITSKPPKDSYDGIKKASNLDAIGLTLKEQLRRNRDQEAMAAHEKQGHAHHHDKNNGNGNHLNSQPGTGKAVQRSTREHHLPNQPTELNSTSTQLQPVPVSTEAEFESNGCLQDTDCAIDMTSASHSAVRRIPSSSTEGHMTAGAKRQKLGQDSVEPSIGVSHDGKEQGPAHEDSEITEDPCASKIHPFPHVIYHAPDIIPMPTIVQL